jgi:RND family efflux transporter MFP subunit
MAQRFIHRRLARRFFLSIALFAAFAPSLTAAQGDATAFPPARVEVTTASLRDLAPVVEIPGTVVSVNDSRVAAEVSGVLIWVAEVGEAVSAGAAIARIDPRLLEVEVKRARANVARLRADYDYRERQLGRTEELAGRNNASETLVDEARALRDQALHQLAEAAAQLERSEANLERTEIRAAFTGHVTERLAYVGEYVDIGEDVVRLVDTHRIEVSLPAPMALAAHIEPGASVSVHSGGIERRHEVRTVVPVGDAVSRMVEIRLSAESGDWMVGAPVLVSLPSDSPLTLVAVPRDALVERAGRSYIYKINDDGTASQVTPEIQMIVGLWAGIANGVQAGDQVIIRGAERLADGQPVEIITATNSAPAASKE